MTLTTLRMNIAGCLLAGLLFGIGALFAPPAIAEEAQAERIEEIVVVGSRRRDRSAADSPVPVDVITAEDLGNLGATDLDSLLATLVPSYNVDTQPISDAATVMRPASLRGLSSDATLILVNGKRRHRGSVITWLGGGISDGAHAPDVSAIPAIALDRVEVLRDGASAQYGSDAIAGVINFALKDERRGGTIETRWGQHYEGDGSALTVAGHVGLPLGGGFLNLSGEFREADSTSRSVQRADAQELIDAGNAAVRLPAAQIWGVPEVRDDFKLFANAGLELGARSELYAFGNWSQRTVEGGFFFRNPHTRGGVFRGDGGTVKVADLSADGVSGNCPTIPVVDNVADAGAIAAVASNPDCFSFIERFPGGFTPQFGGDVTDFSLATGLRGNVADGWFYDLSVVFGTSMVEHFMHNTINPQLAGEQLNIPTTYFPGTYTESDSVFDLNLSKPVDVGLAAPLNVALGFEYRTESFEREAGGRNSYFVDDRLGGLAAQGFGVGSNGFPGLPPAYAGDESRSSYAAYADLETDLSDRLLVAAAARFEDYEDFGDTLDGKLAGRYQLTSSLAVRGAISTGFRAPTVGQSTVRNVSTVFGAMGLEDRVTLPPTHPVAMQKGGRPLMPEVSTSATLGLAVSAGVVDVTLDYYRIAVEDRIAQSSTLSLAEDDVAALLAAGVSDATSFSSVRFFANAFDTTNRGVDLVLTAPLDFGAGETNLVIAANRNDVDIDRRDEAVIGDDRVKRLSRALPHNRVAVTLNHATGKWRFLGRVRRYGEFYGAPADVESWERTYEPRFIVDAEAAYSPNRSFTLVAGAENLLDEYPQQTTRAAQDGVGMLYPENSPYGFNGGFYYLRAIWRFNQPSSRRDSASAELSVPPPEPLPAPEPEPEFDGDGIWLDSRGRAVTRGSDGVWMDSAGKAIVRGTDGVWLDSIGRPLTQENDGVWLDSAGQAIARTVDGVWLDSQGRPLTQDAHGRWLDSSGQPVFRDDDGVWLDSMGRPGNLVLTFEYDQVSIQEEDREKLQDYTDFLRNNAEWSILVEGHTDARGSDEYNQRLGLRRANSVRDGLLANGIAAHRIEVVSFGESRPVESSDTQAGRAMNRRAVIICGDDQR